MADILKGKDSLMKRLLSTAPNLSLVSSMTMPPSCPSAMGDSLSNVPSPVGSSGDDNSSKLTNFLRQLASQTGREMNIVLMDHAYSKPTNWRSENAFAKPTKTLFVVTVPSAVPGSKDEQEVDIESVPETPVPPYDVAAVSIAMSECEVFVNSLKLEEPDEDWEEKINKTNWTTLQQRVFTKLTRALLLDRVARLTCEGSWNEPVQRRIIVNRTARRIRHLLSGYGWDMKLTQWLHATLLEYLSPTYLVIYLDVLQTMRAKAPALVDRMLANTTAVNRQGFNGLESLSLIMKQPWDPVASSLNEHKPQRLPGNPILLMVPSTPVNGASQSSRQKQWESYFSSLGMVTSVMAKSDPDTGKMSLTSCLDQMMCTTRVKVAQLRSEYPGRHVILIGWNAGASVACQVALVEPVSAVVCLGFTVHTVEGRRGEPNDSLLDLCSPVFFVIGQNAAASQQEDLEDIRERMRVETGLVVVGSADDQLRVSNSKKQSEGVAQNMVDRCILDEIGDFLGSMLMHPRPPPMRTIPSQLTNISGLTGDLPNNGIIKVEKRKNPGSEPSSPASKRSRPGTPLHGAMPPVVTTAPSTPTSKSTLATLPTLVSVSGPKGPRQKPRMTAAQKLQSASGSPDPKWGTPVTAGQQTNPEQVSPAPTGITVNIGSLGSLTPIGPIRLSQTSTTLPTSISSPNPSMTDGTSLTIQGNLISSGAVSNLDKSTTASTRGIVSGKTLQLQGKQLVTSRGMGKAADSGTLTSLSSLLQNGSAARIMVSSAPSLLLAPSTHTTTVPGSQQLKVLGSEENLQELISSSNSNSRMRTTSGRMLDLSKLTVLPPTSSGSTKNLLGTTSAGNVVMLAESPRVSRPVSGGPLLVPVSNVASPFTILPLSNKASSDRSPTQRYTVIPKISVPSLKLNQAGNQQVNVSYSVSPTVLRNTTLEMEQAEAVQHSAEVKDDEDTLTPDKILELPIIFAKDGDDSLFLDNKMESSTMEPPTVVPISSCGSADGSSSTVTLGDTISFPLEDTDNEKVSDIVKANNSTRSVPNVFIIRSKNAKDKSQTGGNKRIIHKTHRFLRAIDKMPPQTPANVKHGSGIKYTKIILTNRNSSVKVGDLEGVSIKHDQLQGLDTDAFAEGSAEDLGLEDVDDTSIL